MAASFQPADEAPMSELNTTPLIDVMLVLLSLFSITIPVTSHNVPVDLPSDGGGEPPEIRRLSLDAAGRTYWDGVPVDARQLGERLAAHAADPADPVLHMSSDGETRYERFDEVLAAVARANVTNVGFDNARFARF
jgi:biopolymer transport protein ExbD